VLGTKRKHNKVAGDHVIIELPPYRGPRSPLDIVAVEHLFGVSLKLFDTYLRQRGLMLLLGMMPSLLKELEHRH
jgi:hypothetical protein